MRLRADQPAAGELFAGVGDPAGGSAHGEDAGEGGRRQAQGFQEQRAARLSRFSAPPDLAALQATAEAVTGQAPNIDFALMAACEAMRLPADAPFGLFAVARCAGWIAHAIEQGQSDALIRPRARYIGPEPEPLAPG